MVQAFPFTDDKTHLQSCSDCALAKKCLPMAFKGDMSELKSIVSSGVFYPDHGLIYHQGEKFRALYVVKSGAVKTYIDDPDGSEHITGFYLPGDMVGLGNIAGKVALSSAYSLGESRICKIHYPSLSSLRRKTPLLSDFAVNKLSEAIASDHDFFNCLTRHTPVSRVAYFLLVMAKRYGRDENYQLEYKMPMPRQDMSTYLGLATETVSRVFTQLVSKQLVQKKNREIKITNLEKLIMCSIAGKISD